MTQLKDRTLTEQAFRQIASHSTQERMKNMAIVLGGGQAQANADKAIAGLQQQYVSDLNKANEHIAQSKLQGGIAEGNVIMKGADIASENYRAQLAADAKSPGKAGIGAAGIEHFDEYYKINPIAGEKLIEKMSYAQATKDALSQVENMIGVRVKGPDGKKTFIPKSTKALDALSKDQKMEIGQNMAHAVLNISKYADFGALSEGDKQLANSVTGATDDWMSYAMTKFGITSYDAMYKRIETLKRNVDNDLKARVGILEVPGADGMKHKLKYNPDWKSGGAE